MSRSENIFLHVWTGDARQARKLVSSRRPGRQIIELSHREVRSSGWKGQITALHGLKGEAFVVFFKSLRDSPQVQLVRWTGLAHRCRETILADESGAFEVYRRFDWLRLLPLTLLSCLRDAGTLIASLILLRLWKLVATPAPLRSGGSTVAYLFPYPLVRDIAGGALSHVRGVFEGMAACGVDCQLFSGAAITNLDGHIIEPKRKHPLFWEALMLSYSLQFARNVRHRLGDNLPNFIYQRHGRFTVAGALLSRMMGVPLVLEYNGSEVWTAKYWDPSRFLTWLRLCEEVSLACASLVVVVSEPMQQELLERGISPERILVNPNAVDPERFRPGCGGQDVRRELGIEPSEVLVGFVGTFGPWHGIQVLQRAIDKMLQVHAAVRMRFLLVGDGALHAEATDFLRHHIESGKVIMTGMVAQDRITSYLDATDILVSPHVRMPDGRRFFGSPTKLFEYMAMEKPIVASHLDQLAEVLTHNDTALLVEPGNLSALCEAVILLARDSQLRLRLGKRARAVAIARHTWQQNAARMLNRAGLEVSVPKATSVLEQQAS